MTIGIKFKGIDGFESWKHWAEERGCRVKHIGCGKYKSYDDKNILHGEFNASTFDGNIPQGRHDCLALSIHKGLNKELSELNL